MDGIFVPNTQMQIQEILELEQYSKLPLDIHLMVNAPQKYIEVLAVLKPFMITFHLDSTTKPKEVIGLLKEHNIRAGIAINPSENINILDDHLKLIDYILVMSVVPGKGGQTFIKDVLKKVKELENNPILIGVDGGINEETVAYLKSYKIDNIISGSYVCMSDDYDKQIENLLNKLS